MLEQLVSETIQPGDVVGIGIHTGIALRGYEVGCIARERGAWVVYGGIHATLYPEAAIASQLNPIDSECSEHEMV